MSEVLNVPSLRVIADRVAVVAAFTGGLNLVVEQAEVFAFNLSSLLDGQEEDDLAEILVPIRDFLKKLAGIS